MNEEFRVIEVSAHHRRFWEHDDLPMFHVILHNPAAIKPVHLYLPEVEMAEYGIAIPEAER